MTNKIKVTRFNAVNAPSEGSGRKIIMVVLGIVLLISGFALGRTFSPSKSSSVNTEKSSAISETKTGVGPYSTKGLVPSKFRHSTKGAIAAASTYIGFTPRFYLLKDAAFSTAINQVSSASFSEALEQGMNKNRVLAQSTFDADPNAFYREIPLGYVVVEESDDEVTIGVWSQVMLVAKPEFNGNTESKIHTMQLVWERDDWKIANWTTAAGPTPRWQSSVDPLPVEDFLLTIQPFTGGYDYAPSF